MRLNPLYILQSQARVLLISTPSQPRLGAWLPEHRSIALERTTRDVTTKTSLWTLPEHRQKNNQSIIWKEESEHSEKFDSFPRQLRRSKTWELDDLITHFEWLRNNRSEVIPWRSPFNSPKLSLRFSATSDEEPDTKERVERESQIKPYSRLQKGLR